MALTLKKLHLKAITTFIMKTKMTTKSELEQYTEQEFRAFLHEIHRAIEDEPDSKLTPLIEHFEKITEHPAGSDLFFRPEGSNQGEPEQVLAIIKEWRAANGKADFKPS
ncbi:bacteriocin immunity protein [Pseudomonas sp. S31]|uniref:bacteriocin immunity protein n=1 Tax=Pseudomonas sp. S31 TaxID=1564473 RepID=UPI001F2ED316|nr:bacteriocin immunity protein [Pseudomonas sp. S31]